MIVQRLYYHLFIKRFLLKEVMLAIGEMVLARLSTMIGIFLIRATPKFLPVWLIPLLIQIAKFRIPKPPFLNYLKAIVCIVNRRQPLHLGMCFHSFLMWEEAVCTSMHFRWKLIRLMLTKYF